MPNAAGRGARRVVRARWLGGAPRGSCSSSVDSGADLVLNAAWSARPGLGPDGGNAGGRAWTSRWPNKESRWVVGGELVMQLSRKRQAAKVSYRSTSEHSALQPADRGPKAPGKTVDKSFGPDRQRRPVSRPVARSAGERDGGGGAQATRPGAIGRQDHDRLLGRLMNKGLELIEAHHTLRAAVRTHLTWGRSSRSRSCTSLIHAQTTGPRRWRTSAIRTCACRSPTPLAPPPSAWGPSRQMRPPGTSPRWARLTLRARRRRGPFPALRLARRRRLVPRRRHTAPVRAQRRQRESPCTRFLSGAALVSSGIPAVIEETPRPPSARGRSARFETLYEGRPRGGAGGRRRGWLAAHA